MASHQESLVAINHLKITSNLANRSGDHAISAIASTMEAMTHLHRSNSAESVEQAQRALAAARSSQLDPASRSIPQLTSMMHFVDINCSLQQIDPPQAMTKMQALHKTLDTSQNDPSWTDDGLVRVPLSLGTAKSLHDSGVTGGVLQVDSRGVVNILINWLPKEEIYALGYLLSAAVTDHRNASDGQKSEKYIKEAKRMVEGKDLHIHLLPPQTHHFQQKCSSHKLVPSSHAHPASSGATSSTATSSSTRSLPSAPAPPTLPPALSSPYSPTSSPFFPLPTPHKSPFKQPILPPLSPNQPATSPPPFPSSSLPPSPSPLSPQPLPARIKPSPSSPPSTPSLLSAPPPTLLTISSLLYHPNSTPSPHPTPRKTSTPHTTSSAQCPFPPANRPPSSTPRNTSNLPCRKLNTAPTTSS